MQNEPIKINEPVNINKEADLNKAREWFATLSPEQQEQARLVVWDEAVTESCGCLYSNK